jgi:predicted ATPase
VLIEKAAGLWGKAGQRSLVRSALIEAVAQLGKALVQIATLPGSGTLRREQIKLQVALANALMHVKGYAAPDTNAAVERAQTFIERAEELGEPPEDPLVLFSILHGFWIANFVAFNGDAMRELAAQFLALAEKQGAIVPLMIGHRVMGISLMYTGDLAEGRAHYDRVIELYNPAEHRSLATRFGQDVRVAILSWRAWAMWLLGHPEAALAEADHAIKDAREMDHAATLMFALGATSITRVWCGNVAAANLQVAEEIALADEKGALFWKAAGMMHHSAILALTDKASNAIQMLISAIAAWRSTGATLWMPLFLSYLALAYAKLGRFDYAWRSIDEAMTTIETTKETWCEAEVNRMAGEVALTAPEPNAAKAVAYFEHALTVARQQQAKSWELRASMSLARLWRDQGKVSEAHELLAPVYGWFTEGFDTRDLKEAKALLEELA